MKRLVLLLTVSFLLAVPAFAKKPALRLRGQQVLRPNAQQPQQPPNLEQQRQNQMRVAIASYYQKKLVEAVGLTDEQVIKLGFFIQSYIDMRFNAAMRRENIIQRLEQLKRQPNPSAELEEELILEKSKLDRNFGNMEGQFIDKIRPDLKTGQAALILSFNQKFFDEDLQGLIDQVRVNVQQRLQEPPPNRPNQQQNKENKQNNPGRTGNALTPGRKN